MADESQKPPEPVKAETKPPAQAQAPAQQAAPDAPKYSKADWRERARMTFGASPHAVMGALHDRDDDALLSEDEVRSALDDFSISEGLS
jgi:hypothetical protein